MVELEGEKEETTVTPRFLPGSATQRMELLTEMEKASDLRREVSVVWFEHNKVDMLKYSNRVYCSLSDLSAKASEM